MIAENIQHSLTYWNEFSFYLEEKKEREIIHLTWQKADWSGFSEGPGSPSYNINQPRDF